MIVKLVRLLFTPIKMFAMRSRFSVSNFTYLSLFLRLRLRFGKEFDFFGVTLSYVLWKFVINVVNFPLIRLNISLTFVWST